MILRTTLPLLLASFPIWLASTARAQLPDGPLPPIADVDPTTSDDPILPAALAAADLRAELDQRVHYDHDDEGTLWARGSHWKMSFDGRKAIYYPLLGPRQMEHYPHALSPLRVSVGEHLMPCFPQAKPHRSSDRIELDRGSFVETYELTPDAVEQLFVFPEVPLGGDLVLRIPTESSLERTEDVAGLQFRSEHGGMKYSRAIAIDARGRRESASTRFVGTTIEIQVSAEFLSTAQAPLVIDPIVTRWSVDTSASKDYNQDVAYDVSTNRWLIVWERADSGNDKDIAYRVVSDYGYTYASGYVNLDSTNWNRPKCANNNAFDNFCVVANVVISGGWQIRGRIISAWDGLPGNTSTISDGFPGEHCINPDIGGDSTTAWYSTFCIVFERLKPSGDSDICYRLAVGTGEPIYPYSFTLAGSIYQEVMPSISKSNDGRQWAVAFDRNNSSVDQVHAGRINWDGNIAGYPYAVMNTTADDVGPRVSTMLNGTTRFLVASASTVVGQKDVVLTAMDGYSELVEVNLGMLEYGGPINYATQDQPCLDSDGTHFFVAYREFVDGNQNILGTGLSLNGSALSVVENRIAIRATINDEFVPAIASKEGAGGTGNRMMITWTDVWKPANSWNIWAAFYALP